MTLQVQGAEYPYSDKIGPTAGSKHRPMGKRHEAKPLINVLVVEDSPVVREFLIYALHSDPGICVIGTACNGEEALDAVRHYRPDVITMDIHMPKMGGLEATRRIMETDPRPIVIVSGSRESGEVMTVFEAMEAGALAVLSPPAGIGHPDHETTVRELVQKVKLMSEVKVVRRWPKVQHSLQAPSPTDITLANAPTAARVVAIGASTGGPPALHTILRSLPKTYAAPLLIVQHMATGFIEGFVAWLAQSSALPVHVAVHDSLVLPGHVYIAPDDHQMKVGQTGRIVLTRDDPENGLRPSVSYLFRSIGDVYGREAAAGLLSGMGRDGAEELRRLRDRGAVTFAQDKESSVVHGMPGEAIRLDAAMLVLSPEKIAGALVSLLNHRRGNT